MRVIQHDKGLKALKRGQADSYTIFLFLQSCNSLNHRQFVILIGSVMFFAVYSSCLRRLVRELKIIFTCDL